MKSNALTADHAGATGLTGNGTSLPSLGTWLSSLIARRRAAFAARALRRQLADMDEALLRDIGIAEGEIWKIRQQHNDHRVQGW